MAKIDVISGFLGAGKTTLIKKLIADAYAEEKIVLIENEFGDVSIDGGFLKDSGIQISEMSSGCICCSLVGDFRDSLRDVVRQFAPDRVVIEPSGVGKLSDVIRAVEDVAKEDESLVLNSFTTVVDAVKCKAYMKNFGEFFNDQVACANCIILSRSDRLSEDKLAAVTALLREHNDSALIITTPWEQLDGTQILHAMEQTSAEFLHDLTHDEHCCCDHDHEHDEHCCCHEHDHEHHHEHDEHCCCDHEHHHEHHHEHDEHCCCHEHDHEHHHEHDEHCCCNHEHHHAEDVFTSWGVETAKAFSMEAISDILCRLDDGAFGEIVRCKGIVPDSDGGWLHFDYVPQEHNIRSGGAEVTGRICVIGAQLHKDKLAELFGLA